MNGWNALTPFPWHVNLYVRTKIEYQYWCGGTLISEAVVVTGNLKIISAQSIELAKSFDYSRPLCVEHEKEYAETVHGINKQRFK